MPNLAAVDHLDGPVAITGATGFIGRALCRRLAERDIPVRALVRRSGEQLPESVLPVHGSLSSASALNELVRGARVVIHCAGAVRGVDRADFDSVNVIGTRELLATIAVRAPQAHLVHLSTLAAREPGLSHYAASKRAAEALIESRPPASCTILRPTAVYGPGDVELLPLLEAMARGIGPAFGALDNRVSLIHVADLVDAILAACRPGIGLGPFPLADARPDGYRWTELAAAVTEVTGRQVRLVRVPTGVLAALSHANRLVARALASAPMFTPGKVRELTHPDWSCDPSAFRAATGWAPAIDLVEGLRSVLETP